MFETTCQHVKDDRIYFFLGVWSSNGIMHTSQSLERWNIIPAWFKRSDPRCSNTS